jgi:signal transduction histidine kinase
MSDDENSDAHLRDMWYISATPRDRLMRVSTKLTLALSATCLLIMGLHGYRQLRDEDRDLRAAVEREVTLLGNAMRVEVENSLRDRQVEDIQGLLAATDRIDPTIEVVFFDPAGTLRAASPGAPTDTDLSRQAMEGSATGKVSFRFEEADDPGRAVLTLPLRATPVQKPGVDGSLVLIRPLTEMKRDLVGTRRNILTSGVLLVLAVTAVSFLLGTVYVTRPLTKMARAMQQLRSEHWTSRLGDARQDEVGMLSREFDAMVSALDEAGRNLTREIESRTNLERVLQHVDKLVTVGQISAGLAHEIGSPLQIMSGRARALLLRDHSPEETRKNVRILAEQTDRIARIVDQLLRFARRRPARFAETSLAGPVQTVLDLIEHTARRRGVAIELTVAPDLPTVVADVDQIQQIVLNLAKNALEAIRPGGAIRIRIQPSWLQAQGSSRRVPGARLEVEDDGCGMSEEVLGRLFDPFFTTRETDGGTGLGLAVVKAIVMEHGGVIVAASTPGQGSRFTIDLPLGGPDAMRQVLEAQA